jgi:hypothetical protein
MRSPSRRADTTASAAPAMARSRYPAQGGQENPRPVASTVKMKRPLRRARCRDRAVSSRSRRPGRCHRRRWRHRGARSGDRVEGVLAGEQPQLGAAQVHPGGGDGAAGRVPQPLYPHQVVAGLGAGVDHVQRRQPIMAAGARGPGQHSGAAPTPTRRSPPPALPPAARAAGRLLSAPPPAATVLSRLRTCSWRLKRCPGDRRRKCAARVGRRQRAGHREELLVHRAGRNGIAGDAGPGNVTSHAGRLSSDRNGPRPCCAGGSPE